MGRKREGEREGEGEMGGERGEDRQRNAVLSKVKIETESKRRKTEGERGHRCTIEDTSCAQRERKVTAVSCFFLLAPVSSAHPTFHQYPET